MSRVRSKNTSPEIMVRRLVHRMGYRFRLHKRDLPGTPDLVFAGRHAVIFVHGCFWHRHPNCKKASIPKSRDEFWTKKFDRNVERDTQVRQKLSDNGWKVLVVWECEVKDLERLSYKVKEFFKTT